MSRLISLYPTLNDSLRTKIGYQATSYKFFYSNGVENLDLNTDQTDDHGSREDYIKLKDKSCEWNAQEHGISFSRNISIDIPSFLFGENGVAGLNSELGIGIIWTSKTSNERGSIKIGSFPNVKEAVDLCISTTFSPGKLGSSVSLQTVLYLKTPGNMREEELHLANTSGTLLGILDSFTVIIDGNGSIFPVVQVEEKGYPLWWIECDWADPMTDEFSEENIKICLNKTHKHFESINFLEGIEESPLFIEIISSAMHSIILKVKETEEWTEISQGRGFESGSIGEAIYYFLSTFEWDVTSPEKLALSIRRDLEERL